MMSLRKKGFRPFMVKGEPIAIAGIDKGAVLEYLQAILDAYESYRIDLGGAAPVYQFSNAAESATQAYDIVFSTEQILAYEAAADPVSGDLPVEPMQDRPKKEAVTERSRLVKKVEVKKHTPWSSVQYQQKKALPLLRLVADGKLWGGS